MTRRIFLGTTAKAGAAVAWWSIAGHLFAGGGALLPDQDSSQITDRSMLRLRRAAYEILRVPPPYKPMASDASTQLEARLGRLFHLIIEFDQRWSVASARQAPSALEALSRTFFEAVRAELRRVGALSDESAAFEPEKLGLSYAEAFQRLILVDLTDYLASQGLAGHFEEFDVCTIVSTAGQSVLPHFRMPTRFYRVVAVGLPKGVGDERLRRHAREVVFVVPQPVEGLPDQAVDIDTGELGFTFGFASFLRHDKITEHCANSRESLRLAIRFPGIFANELGLRQVIAGIKVLDGARSTAIQQVFVVESYPVDDIDGAASYANLKLLVNAARRRQEGAARGEISVDVNRLEAMMIEHTAWHEGQHLDDMFSPEAARRTMMAVSMGDETEIARELKLESTILAELSARLVTLQNTPNESLRSLLASLGSFSSLARGDLPVKTAAFLRAEKEIFDTILQLVAARPDRYGIEIDLGGLTVRALDGGTVRLDTAAQIVAQFYKLENAAALAGEVNRRIGLEQRILRFSQREDVRGRDPLGQPGK